MCLLHADALVDLVAHPNLVVRAKAWHALEQFGDSRLVAVLRERLANEPPDIRQGEPAVLTRLSNRKQGSVVKWSGPLSPDLVTLGNLLTSMPGQREQLPLVLSLLDSRVAATRDVAARALLTFGQTGADALFEREFGRAGPLSTALLWLLGELGDSRGVRLIGQRYTALGTRTMRCYRHWSASAVERQ